MQITYYGHSAFKLTGKNGTVFLDPFSTDGDWAPGWPLPAVTADIVTSSHAHPDHNAVAKIKGTARRPDPFIITQPGEYEVGGISVFGAPTFHDDKGGAERGLNTVFTVLIDDIRVCHLGDLGHTLTSEQLNTIGIVDVLLCPVGGFFTIGPKEAVEVIQQLEPSYVIPMHYQTPEHTPSFKDLKPLDAFLKEYGASPTPVPKLNVEKTKLPEETELVVLTRTS